MFPTNTPPRRTSRPALAVIAIALSIALAGGCSTHDARWRLTDVSGHLPDLDFALTDDTNHPATAATYAGRVALVYFGYTHCPDVCPETMARLTQAVAQLGADAHNVRVVFISVDPARDTPALLHAYVDAFDARHAVGLTGADSQIETLARRYRVAYQADPHAAGSDYAVTHSSAVYVFDTRGRARLMATDHDTPDAIAQDVRRLLAASRADGGAA